MIMMDYFGEMVRKKRREKGLSVRALVDACSERGVRISRSSINFLEMGKNLPTYSVAFSVAEVLGIDPEKALKAVFKQRVEHLREREKSYLEEFLRENKQISLDQYRITK